MGIYFRHMTSRCACGHAHACGKHIRKHPHVMKRTHARSHTPAHAQRHSERQRGPDEKRETCLAHGQKSKTHREGEGGRERYLQLLLGGPPCRSAVGGMRSAEPIEVRDPGEHPSSDGAPSCPSTVQVQIALHAGRRPSQRLCERALGPASRKIFNRKNNMFHSCTKNS